MMDVYDSSIYVAQRYLQWPEINFRDEHPISFSFFQDLKEKYQNDQGGGSGKRSYIQG